ncbi:MAG: (5-formylfuran-3-yl)methyl phosphate synthase [Nitrososphaerales archaeon]
MVGRDQLKIMVSVTNPEEALDAVEGGAEIIDVKNPGEGALGANPPWITRSIREAVGESVEVSATLGDMPYLPGTASLAALGAALLRVDYVKVGMLGPKTTEEALNISRSLVRTFQEFRLGVRVVVAGYADYRERGCVNPLTLPQVASESGAWGLLTDVKEKGSKGVFDYLSFEELKRFVDESHSSGLKVALAGSLGKEDIQNILRLGADIMGVRRGVCTSQHGRFKIDRRRVEEIAGALYQMRRSE